jgi:ABC-type branched-subunit amino acid transport system ATPase component
VAVIDVHSFGFMYPGAQGPAVRDVAFSVEPGEIFGFLGPSGGGTGLLPIAIVAGFSAPLLALVPAIAAPNKVAGFAAVKAMNSVNPLAGHSVFRPSAAAVHRRNIPDVLADARPLVGGGR